MAIANEQVVNAPFLYVNGLVPSWVSNTTLSVTGGGQCRDSSNTYDIVGPSGATTINGAINGINGLDTGSLALSTVYNIFIISDPTNNPGRPVGFLLSTSATPLLPFGYGAYRLIGYWATDASVHFLLGYVSGNGSGKRFTYDAPQATAVTAGAATSYTAVDLTKWVPVVNNILVSIAFSFTPGAASRTLKLQPVNATGDAVTITGQVTSVVVSGNASLLAQVATGKPEINYVVANSGDAVALNVAAFDYNL